MVGTQKTGKPQGQKSRGHSITMNTAPNPGGEKLPYRLNWKVGRRGGNPGFDVQMHRNSDREGAEEFAARWGVKLPPGGLK